MDTAQLILVLFPTGFLAGHVASAWALWLLHQPLPSSRTKSAGSFCGECGHPFRVVGRLRRLFLPGVCPSCQHAWPVWPLFVALATGMLFSAFGWSLVIQGCQTVTEVRPSMALWQQRLPFHLLFLFLLIVATITDLLDYSIPDLVVLPGAVIAVLLATLSGELQMIHVWVSWDAELVDLMGPYLPEWMKNHQHLHGLVWSVSGMVTGAGLMWTVRVLASTVLGYPAIGFGDVTLMAMIGAFLGWQPVLCALAIAPAGGLVIGLLVRLMTGRSFVAFGPYLAFAAVAVLFQWKILWENLRLRNLFSHWPTIAGLVLSSLAALGLLLGLLRIFRSVPATKLRK